MLVMLFSFNGFPNNNRSLFVLMLVMPLGFFFVPTSLALL
jgi:hypothetical protein